MNGDNTQTAISLFRENGRDDCVSYHEHTQLIVRTLAHRRLLIRSGGNGKEVTSIGIQIPERTLLSEGSRLTPAVRTSSWSVFLGASLKVSWRLWCYSMQRTARGNCNEKQPCTKAQATNCDVLERFVAVFHDLRSFCGRKYLCLCDSLALPAFLPHRRFFPQWMFGVKAELFGTHCRVQDNDYVLNDSVKCVSGFTPMMVI